MVYLDPRLLSTRTHAVDPHNKVRASRLSLSTAARRRLVQPSNETTCVDIHAWYDVPAGPKPNEPTLDSSRYVLGNPDPHAIVLDTWTGSPLQLLCAPSDTPPHFTPPGIFHLADYYAQFFFCSLRPGAGPWGNRRGPANALAR